MDCLDDRDSFLRFTNTDSRSSSRSFSFCLIPTDGEEEIIEYEEEENPPHSAVDVPPSDSNAATEGSIYGENPSSSDSLANGNHQDNSDEQTLEEGAFETQPGLKTKRSHEDAYGELNGEEGEIEEAGEHQKEIWF